MTETQTDTAVEETTENEAPKIEPIAIEPEDLTEDGKQKKEEKLKRSVPDFDYKVAGTEDRPGSVVALTIEMGREDFQNEQTLLLKDLNKQVTLPGFRKGKAPLGLLRKRVGEDSDRETIGSLATNALRQQNAKDELKMISKPHVVDFDLSDGDKISFVIEVEVEPKVELKQFSGFEVEVEQGKVTDDTVNQRLEDMRQRNAILESAGDDAVVGEGSVIVADLDVTDADGAKMESLSQQGQQFFDYKSQLPKEVAEALEGKKAGETVEATAESTTTNRRGEEVTHKDNYKVTIKEIKIEKLPELDDEFAKDLGEHDTLADLKAAVKKELEKSEDERFKQAASRALYEKLIEANEVEAPRSLVAQQQYNMIMQDSYQMERMGLKLEQVVQDSEQYLASQRDGAEKSVKVQLILNALREQEKLEVSDEDVENEIKRMAEESGRKPLAVRARLEAEKQLDSLKGELANRKIVDFLMEKNTIKAVEPKPAEDKAEGEEDKPKKKTAKKAAKKTAAKKSPAKKKED